MWTSRITPLVLILGVSVILVGSGCTQAGKKARHLKRAEAYFAEGKYQQAEIEYLNVLRFEHTNMTAVARLGIIYAEQGARMKALPMLLTARKYLPTNAEVQIKTIMALQGMGLRNDARTEAAKLLTTNPTEGEALLILMNLSRASNEVAEAENILGAFRQKNGDNAHYYLAAANLFLKKGDASSAENAIRQALAKDARLYGTHLAMASLHLARSNLVEADKEFKTAVDLAPSRSGVSLSYAEFKLADGKQDEARKILKETTSKAPDYLPAWRMLGRISLGEKKPDETLEHVSRILLKDPVDFGGLELRGRAHFAKNERAKGLKDFETLVMAVGGFATNWYKMSPSSKNNADALARAKTDEEIKKVQARELQEIRTLQVLCHPDLPEAYYLLAGAYLANTNIVRAIDSLKLALSFNPDYVDAHILLARINLRGNRAPEQAVQSLANLSAGIDKAIKNLEEKLGKDKVPDHPIGRRMNNDYLQVSLVLAEAYRETGRLDDAAQLMHKLSQTYSENYALLFGYGVALRQLKKDDEARTVFENVLKMDPASPPALMQLTDMDMKGTNVTVALQRVETALTQKSDVPQLHHLRGLINAASSNTLDQAETDFRKALELNEEYMPAYSQLARVYLAKRKPKEAADQLSAVLEKEPNDAISAMMLADIYKTMEQFDKAGQAYEKLLSVRPNYLPAMNNLANLYAEKLAKLDKAYELGFRARTLSPNNPIVADTMGWIMYRRGDYQQALNMIKESAEKLPEYPEIQFHLAMAYYMNGQPEAALPLLQQAANSKFDFPGKDEATNRLAALQGTSGKPPAELVKDLEKIVAENPKDIVILVRLGDAYQQIGQTDKAAETYEKALKVNPQFVEAMVKVAQLYGGPLKKPDQALEYAKRARELAPNDPQAASVLGRLAWQKSDFMWAYSLFTDSARNRPDNAEAQFDLGWACYGLGKIAECRQAMQKVVALKPPQSMDSTAKWLLVMLDHYESLKNPAEAEKQANDLLKNDPNYAPSLMVLGRLQAGRGQAKEAIANFEKVLARFPQFTPAMRELAVLYADDPGRAQTAFELGMKARETMPNDALLAKALGKINHHRKDYRSTIRYMQECLRSLPSDPEALFFLGSAHAQLKETAPAKDALEKALAAGLKEPLAAQAKQMLAGIK